MAKVLTGSGVYGKENNDKVPEAYFPLLEDIRLLTADQNNPNRTTLRQQEQIWHSLQKYGWAYPIIANKDGVYVDGEQRAEVCKQHGEFFAPVLRLPVTDVDRRLLRQILNKLKGKHNKELTQPSTYAFLQMGEKEDLKALLGVGWREGCPRNLMKITFQLTIPATYEIIVECKDEADQKTSLIS